MMNFMTIKSKYYGSQKVTGNKTGKKQLFGEWLCIIYYGRNEFLHDRVLRIIGQDIN